MNKITILFICILTTLSIHVSATANNKFTVVIDPGHGGRDSGAIRGKYKEKTINLSVALALGQQIEANYKNVKVVYTRKTDTFVSLDDRTELANQSKANLFISIHTNSTAARNTTAVGADTYILGLARSAENLEVAKRENSVILLEDDYNTKYEGFDPKSPESYIIFEFMTNKYMDQSLQLASNIQSSFKSVAKRQDRGVRQAGFLVLRKSSMPSVLIELGFINNTNEAKFLSSTAGQKSMANAIYTGFKKYKDNFERMQGGQSTANNKTESNATSTNKASQGEMEYRIQFLTSPRQLPSNSTQLKGLSPVEYYMDNITYKYTYGSTTNYQEILTIHKTVKQKFKDSFIIRFKDGKRVQ